MRSQSGKIDGNALVDDQAVFHGMVTGNITVVSGALLHLHGMCSGFLLVLKGGNAVIHGTVVGDVINHGDVELHGIVDGNVISLGGSFVALPGAIVKGTVAS